MRKQVLHPIDLSKVMGAEAAQATTDELKTAVGDDLKFDGKKIWHRLERPTMRIEWREEGDKLIFSFYHPEGPDPMLRHDDPTAVRIDERGNEVVDVAHGRPIGLPDAFGDLLPKVCDYVFEKLGYTFGYVDETCAWRVEVPGVSHRLVMRKRYTTDFFDILCANYRPPA
ncbi:MAG: hypothetical protein KDB07_03215 [Planctomycetes bacterium]|nr:hypothetical protein [Planctomycetota bacterium]